MSNCNSGFNLPEPPAYVCCPPEPPAQGCPAVWGSITGTLGNQTDLVAKLGEYATSEDVEEAIDDLGATCVKLTGNQEIDGLKSFNTPLASQGVQVGSGNDTYSTIVGRYSVEFPTSASSATFVGAEAGFVMTGSGGTGNTALGAYAGPDNGNLNLTTAIGYQAKATRSGQVMLGGPNTTETVLRGELLIESKLLASSAGDTTANVVLGSAIMLATTDALVVENSKVNTSSVIFVNLQGSPGTTPTSVWATIIQDGEFTINSNPAVSVNTPISFLVLN